jgi:hypothetical protein
MDSKMKSTINAIYRDGGEGNERRKSRKPKKSISKKGSHRSISILERSNTKSINAFLSKSKISNLGKSGNFNMKYQVKSNRKLHSSKPSVIKNTFMNKNGYGISQGKYSTLIPTKVRNKYKASISIPEGVANRTFHEGSLANKTYDHKGLNSLMGSSNKIRDNSLNFKHKNRSKGLLDRKSKISLHGY